MIRGVKFFECSYHRKLCYGVELVSTGYKAVFNHRKYVLNNLIALVQDGGNICRDYYNNMLLFQNGKKYMSLAKYLFCLYNKINPDEVEFNNNIRHKNKRFERNIENCLVDNLYLGGVSVYLDEEHNRMVVKSNTKKMVDEFEAVPVLVDIMQSKNFVLEWNDKERLMCRIKDKLIFPVANLAYLAYYDDLTMDNYIDKLRTFQRYKEELGLSIEHLDGNYHVHYKYNIALVEQGLNSKKCDMISHIKEPYFFTVVIDNGKFKIVVGQADDELMLDSKLFITEYFENVVGLLFAYKEIYPEIFNKTEAVEENTGMFFDRKFCEAIVRMSDDAFKSLDTLGENREV